MIPAQDESSDEYAPATKASVTTLDQIGLMLFPSSPNPFDSEHYRVALAMPGPPAECNAPDSHPKHSASRPESTRDRRTITDSANIKFKTRGPAATVTPAGQLEADQVIYLVLASGVMQDAVFPVDLRFHLTGHVANRLGVPRRTNGGGIGGQDGARRQRRIWQIAGDCRRRQGSRCQELSGAPNSFHITDPPDSDSQPTIERSVIPARCAMANVQRPARN